MEPPHSKRRKVRPHNRASCSQRMEPIHGRAGVCPWAPRGHSDPGRGQYLEPLSELRWAEPGGDGGHIGHVDYGADHRNMPEAGGEDARRTARDAQPIAAIPGWITLCLHAVVERGSPRAWGQL